jgi:Right handed beta helix region
MKCSLLLFFLFLACATQAAEVKVADPSDYRKVLQSLTAGDTLRLAAGIYTTGLPVTMCHGRADAWITIEGPAQGEAEIRQTAEANCVELRQCSYLALKRLKIQGGGPTSIPGLFGISAMGGEKNTVHHILIEDCIIRDWNTSQQAVGISTKTTTWGWTIRRNQIINCGTGLYLGNSNGNEPFIQGVIEHNLVQNPIGYCMEIKYQNPRPNLEQMPTAPGSTIIRHNVFIKNDAPSPDGDRPNLLVGGFPATGPGSSDLYEIYGNFFLHNPRESLLHASGRVSIHDNVFADCPSAEYAAINLRDHDLPLRLAHVYNNTITDAWRGIRISKAPSEAHAIIGNVVFAE